MNVFFDRVCRRRLLYWSRLLIRMGMEEKKRLQMGWWFSNDTDTVVSRRGGCVRAHAWGGHAVSTVWVIHSEIRVLMLLSLICGGSLGSE